jgi:hypothetical protein
VDNLSRKFDDERIWFKTVLSLSNHQIINLNN